MFSLLRRIRPEYFFLVFAIIFEISYTVFRPPLQSPDEFNHFWRAYQISEGNFLPVKKGQRLGGEMPAIFTEVRHTFGPFCFTRDNKISSQEILSIFKMKIENEEKVFFDFPNTAYYSPVSYLPHALALVVLGELSNSVGVLYYGGKFFVFITWIFCMFLVIRTLPFYRWLFTFLILLPMNLYIVNSYSADTVTNILSFLLIAFTLKYTFLPCKLNSRAWLFFLMVALLLAASKVVYIGLLLMLMMVPVQRFKTQRQRIFFLGLVLTSAFLCAVAWSRMMVDSYMLFDDYHPAFRETAALHNEANLFAQKEHLLSHPMHFFLVAGNTLVASLAFAGKSLIGTFGAIMDIVMPDVYVILAYILIFMLAVIEPSEFKLNLRHRLILLITFITVYLLLVLTQHLTWNRVGSDHIADLQGRYFLPIFPLLLMSIQCRFQKLSLVPLFLVLFGITVSNIVALREIYLRFY